MKRPVLLVSSATGTGHLRAADAVRDALLARDPSLSVEHVELLSIAPRWVRKFYGSMFETVVARAPRIWGEIYRFTDGCEHDRARWAPVAHRLLFREFRRLLLSRPWSLCLCTHFLPCQLAAGRTGLPPFGLVVTDFELHRVWAQPGVSRYFVATERLQRDLRSRVRRGHIDVTGIPIAPAFAQAPSRAEARAALGLPQEKRMALIMGGGLGIGVEEATLAALHAAPRDALLVAVCGRNDAAQTRLSSLAVPGDRLRVYGQVSGMERFVAAADVVATKPGGLSVSEALAVGRPLVLTRPIPGAEEGNAHAVVAEGAGFAAFSPAEMADAFGRVLADEGLLARMSAAARAIGRPHAAESIAASVERDFLARAAA